MLIPALASPMQTLRPNLRKPISVCVIKNNHWNYPYYMERRLQGKVVRDFEMTKGKILEVTYEMLRVAWSPVGHDL